ncbi:7757_t:CDS:2, partial [Paraglomus occultum]
NYLKKRKTTRPDLAQEIITELKANSSEERFFHAEEVIGRTGQLSSPRHYANRMVLLKMAILKLATSIFEEENIREDIVRGFAFQGIPIETHTRSSYATNSSRSHYCGGVSFLLYNVEIKSNFGTEANV